MTDSKAPGTYIKGRKLGMVGIKNDPEMWVIFDEPEGFAKEEQDETCKTYHYQSRLHAFTAFVKIVKAYKRSRKNHYTHAIKLRKSNG